MCYDCGMATTTTVPFDHLPEERAEYLAGLLTGITGPILAWHNRPPQLEADAIEHEAEAPEYSLNHIADEELVELLALVSHQEGAANVTATTVPLGFRGTTQISRDLAKAWMEERTILVVHLSAELRNRLAGLDPTLPF